MAFMPVMPRDSKDWTVDDLDQLPEDDGLQYELLDGVLLVSPSPAMVHQWAAANLFSLIVANCPSSMKALFAPFDYRPDRQTSLQPDVFVFQRKDQQATFLEAPPVIAVEVLSPSTRSKDLVWKRDKYERSGVLHYWIVDPAVPSILALELVEGRYVEVGRATGAEELLFERPFPVRIVPLELVND